MINNISSETVKSRIKDINKETPVFWTNLVKEPQEISLRMTARNNLMLDQVLANQAVIIDNQNKIMEKMGIGNKLNIQG